MIAIPEQNYLTPEEYLNLEAKSTTKHEYHNGEAYAMAGTTDTHNTIAGNLYSLIRNHLRGSDCRVYFADIKAKLEKCNCFYYPYIMVTCDSRDQENSTYKLYPKLIIEILSDSTEAFDRGDKFINYSTLNTLEEYVLISTKQQRVECYRRKTEDNWTFQFYTPDKTKFKLESINLETTFSLLYEDI